jgi:hypothetical protein
MLGFDVVCELSDVFITFLAIGNATRNFEISLKSMAAFIVVK